MEKSKTGVRFKNCVKCGVAKKGEDQLVHWCYTCYLKSEEVQHDREKYGAFCVETYMSKKYMFRRSQSEEEEEEGEKKQQHTNP